MASTPYYTLSSFNLLGSVALLYSAATNLFFGVTRRKIERLPPPVPQQPRRPRPYSCGSASDGVAIVTGCNTGIGYETARSLVQDYGFTVVMACRSRDKAQAAAQQINQHSGGENNGGKAVFVHPLDLSSFDSVRSFCKQVKDQFKQIHVLINNAGRNTNGVSDDSNLDLLFQSNFLGHYLLTSLLMDNMAENARIVNLSSVMHHFCAGSALDSVEFWKKTAVAGEQPRNTYSLSKLAALLFTVALNQRYRNIRSYAVSPGSVNSDIWRDGPRFLIPIFSFLYLNNAKGCRTSVVAAVSDDLPAHCYYLQPYWLPGTSQAVAPFPALEMLGPYQGYHVTTARLPADGGMAAASALWIACADISGATWPQPK